MPLIKQRAVFADKRNCYRVIGPGKCKKEVEDMMNYCLGSVRKGTVYASIF
jgi:hypothetical protein